MSTKFVSVGHKQKPATEVMLIVKGVGPKH